MLAMHSCQEVACEQCRNTPAENPPFVSDAVSREQGQGGATVLVNGAVTLERGSLRRPYAGKLLLHGQS